MIVADIRKDDALETADSLVNLEGASYHTHFELDVTSSEQISEFMEKVKKEYKRHPCIAVNSHGITRDDFIVKMSEERFNEVVNVNLKVLVTMHLQ